MELDKIFTAFVNPQTVIVCLAIYLLTYVIRKVVEGAWKGAKENRLWREVWLPIGPIANGALVGLLAKTFVWPAVVGTSLSGRVMYGAICGVFSALIYNRIRSWIQSAPPKKGAAAGPEKTNPPSDPPSDPPLPGASDPPPAEDPPADPPAPTGRA